MILDTFKNKMKRGIRIPIELYVPMKDNTKCKLIAVLANAKGEPITTDYDPLIFAAPASVDRGALIEGNDFTAYGKGTQRDIQIIQCLNKAIQGQGYPHDIVKHGTDVYNPDAEAMTTVYGKPNPTNLPALVLEPCQPPAFVKTQAALENKWQELTNKGYHMTVNPRWKMRVQLLQ